VTSSSIASDFLHGTLVEDTLIMNRFRGDRLDSWSDEEVAKQIRQMYEQAENEALKLLHSRAVEEFITPAREWMTATQLAEYWQLSNDKNEPTTAGILKWAKRPPEDFPLPHAYMGDLLRFNRDEVDQWAHEEAERRRVQNAKRRLKIA